MSLLQSTILIAIWRYHIFLIQYRYIMNTYTIQFLSPNYLINPGKSVTCVPPISPCNTNSLSSLKESKISEKQTTSRLTVKTTAMKNLKTMFESEELKATDSAKSVHGKDTVFRQFRFKSSQTGTFSTAKRFVNKLKFFSFITVIFRRIHT